MHATMTATGFDSEIFVSVKVPGPAFIRWKAQIIARLDQSQAAGTFHPRGAKWHLCTPVYGI
jgi:hypothetical protein